MTELSEASLEAMLKNIRKHMDETGEKITLIPTQFIVRPADLEKLGLTVYEVTKMIKEQSA
jgi:predicted rRNA methylase YqxC with S4 and FtsJ domains